MSIEAVKQALEGKSLYDITGRIEDIDKCIVHRSVLYQAIAEDERLRALAQPKAEQEQEPLGYIDMREWPPVRFREGLLRCDLRHLDGAAIFTHPQPKAQLVAPQQGEQA